MRSWILLLIALATSALAPAQERTAHVLLENGSELSGRVVAMDLTQLQLVIGEEIVTIAASDIKSCRFEWQEQPVGEPVVAPVPAPAPMGETAAVPPPAPDGPDGPRAGEAEPGAAEPGATPAVRRAGSGEDAPPRAGAGSVANVPIDPPAPRRASSRLGARLEVVDSRYPWLSPTDPLQWFSLGLLLFSGLSLIIHLSVVVAGAEQPQFGRSLGLALLYLVAAAGQIALVPGSDLGVFSMLIGNTAVILFALSGLFGLARSNAFVAFAVQVGLLAVGFGALELVDSLLGSVGVT